MITALTFVRAPFGGLVDTTTLEYTAANDLAYGPIRMMGTVGYGLVAFVMGILATRSLGLAFSVYPVIAVFAVVCLLCGPQIPGHASRRERLQVLPILRSRNLRLLFLLNGAVYFCFIYYQHFYNEYVLDILQLPTWVWGLNTFATIALELPFFFLFDRIMKKVSLKTMLTLCMAVSVVRYLLLPTVTTGSRHSADRRADRRLDHICHVLRHALYPAAYAARADCQQHRPAICAAGRRRHASGRPGRRLPDQRPRDPRRPVFLCRSLPGYTAEHLLPAAPAAARKRRAPDLPKKAPGCLPAGSLF